MGPQTSLTLSIHFQRGVLHVAGFRDIPWSYDARSWNSVLAPHLALPGCPAETGPGQWAHQAEGLEWTALWRWLQGAYCWCTSGSVEQGSKGFSPFTTLSALSLISEILNWTVTMFRRHGFHLLEGFKIAFSWHWSRKMQGCRWI